MEQADAKIPDLTIIYYSPPMSIMLTHPYSVKSAKPERGMTGPATSRQGCSPEKGEDPHRGFSEASSPARRATPKRTVSDYLVLTVANVFDPFL